MYNIVIGNNVYSSVIIDSLIKKNKSVILLDSVEELKLYKNSAIIKNEVDLNDMKMLESQIEKQDVENIFVATRDDELNYMIAEALKFYPSVYMILNDEYMFELMDKDNKYKVLCPQRVIRNIIDEEVA
jgi:Trk K+ transport system NAD-binding subunit